MPVEKSLDEFKKSSIVWLIGIIVPVVVLGSLNAKGLFDDVQEIRTSLAAFQNSQKLINDQLMQSLNEQRVTNEHLSDRLDADDTIIRTLLSTRGATQR